MNTTSIEWSDRSWNPVSGCSHVSEGCRNCYAERVFPRVYGMDRETVPTPADGIIPENYIRPESVTGHWKRPRKFSDVRCHSDRLDQPLRIKKPQKIFVNSMSDLFHEDVPDAFIVEVFKVAAMTPWHTYQVLTKRPARMQKFLAGSEQEIIVPLKQLQLIGGVASKAVFGALDRAGRMEGVWRWPLPNVWLGVSVEDQKTADERIPLLLETPAAVRWISVEPLLGPVDLVNFFWRPDPHGAPSDFLHREELQWVVVGGESGPRARVMEEGWAYTIMEQCRMAGVPFFMKQLSQATLKSGFKDIHNFPEHLRVREFPEEPTP